MSILEDHQKSAKLVKTCAEVAEAVGLEAKGFQQNRWLSCGSFKIQRTTGHSRRIWLQGTQLLFSFSFTACGDETFRCGQISGTASSVVLLDIVIAAPAVISAGIAVGFSGPSSSSRPGSGSTPASCLARKTQAPSPDRFRPSSPGSSRQPPERRKRQVVEVRARVLESRHIVF